MKAQKISTIIVSVVILGLLAFLCSWYYPGIISLTVVGVMMDPGTVTPTQSFLCIFENNIYWLSSLSTVILSVLLLITVLKAKDDVLVYVKKLKKFTLYNIAISSFTLLMNIVFGFINDSALFFFLYMAIAIVPSIIEMLLCVVLKNVTMKGEREGII